PLDLGFFFLAVWGAGTTVTILVQLVRILRVQRLIARSRPAPRSVLRQVEELAERMGVRAPLTRVVPGLGSPFVWGLGQAKLLWPCSLMDRLAMESRRS